MKSFSVVRVVMLLLVSTFGRSFAQSPTLRFEHLTVEDGLSHWVSDILQDREGYLWFGRVDGLTKYDGYQLTTYQFVPHDSTSITQNAILKLWEDREGNLWMGTGGEGICKFDRRTEQFTTYHLPQPKGKSAPTFGNVSSINEDKEGMMWVGSYMGELRRFNKQTGEFSEPYDMGYRPGMDEKQDTHDEILCIFRDRPGTLWVGNHTGLHRLNLIPGKAGQPSRVSFTHYQHDPANLNSLSYNRIFSIFEDRKSLLWIGTGAGLNRLDPTTGKITRYLHDPNNPHSISNDFVWRGIGEDLQGNLWIGVGDKINRLNPARTKFSHYAHDPAEPTSFGSEQVYWLLVDRAGTVWASAVGAGISKADPPLKPFASYRPYPDGDFTNNWVNSVCEDKEGIVWVGTNKGLHAFNPKTGTFTHYLHDPNNPNSLAGDFITAISEDRQGQLWVLSRGQFSRFDRSSGTFSHSSGNAALDKILEKGLYSFYEDRQGLLWLNTGEGIESFNPQTGAVTPYRHDPANPGSIIDDDVNVFLEDSRGNLWTGHFIGLSRLNKRTGRFTRYKPNVHDPTSLSSGQIKCLHEDAKGNLWIGTDGAGLCRFDYSTETFTTYTTRQGLASNMIYAIQEDGEGNLWLSTNNGLSRFSLSAHTFTNYDAKDGLLSDVLSTGACKGRDGILYVGNRKGLNVFDPRQIQPNRYVPPVVITQFKLFDKVIPGKNEDREITLDYDENFFSFEFAALNYINTQKNRYAYQLVGFDKDWVQSGARRYASYTNLDPGEYTFRVKASNNDGIWNEKGLSIPILIHPPWWRTWWATLLYGLAFAGSVWGFIYFRSRSLIREKRVLEHKVSIRTAEVVKQKEEILEINEELSQQKEEIATQRDQVSQTLAELQVTQDQLTQKEKMASLGELTAGIAHEIQNPLNFVNNFSEVSRELVEELRQEQQKPVRDSVLEVGLLNDLDQNLSKIHHHGQRADSIVKGMLQHSRTSGGEKQPVDLNALANEYLRLSYHGMRAKGQDFNASLATDFDANLGKVQVVPQELGRVLLNLFNNAFYAIQQKSKTVGNGYQPQVKVRTQRLESTVEIGVYDNGEGIPAVNLKKIFQPFFTTKPTGQGTGLGLSLSYDIITKGHGGELKVETKEGEFAEFIICLPLHRNTPLPDQ